MTAEEIFEEEVSKIEKQQFIKLFYYFNKSKIIDIIKKIQNDAYNQAIDDAAENAMIYQKYYNEYDHKTMFTRWKNKGYPRVDGDGYQYGVDVINIDKESILKLKKK
jgi:hypothetical protein